MKFLLPTLFLRCQVRKYLVWDDDKTIPFPCSCFFCLSMICKSLVDETKSGGALCPQNWTKSLVVSSAFPSTIVTAFPSSLLPPDPWQVSRWNTGHVIFIRMPSGACNRQMQSNSALLTFGKLGWTKNFSLLSSALIVSFWHPRISMLHTWNKVPSVFLKFVLTRQ